MRLKGFTLIELITAIVLVAIIMIPVALIAMEYVRSVAYADSLTAAANLGQREMAIVNNLAYGTLASANFQNYMGYNFDVARQVSPVTIGKKVIVTVYPHGSTEKVTELATYVMNVSFGLGGGSRASYFAASGGSFGSPTNLSGITLQNISTTDSITMIGVILTLSKNNALSSVTMDGLARYTGSLPLQRNVATQVAFQSNFAMSANQTYSGAQGGSFVFNNSFVKNDTVTIIFLFSDGSQSQAYQWKKT